VMGWSAAIGAIASFAVTALGKLLN